MPKLLMLLLRGCAWGALCLWLVGPAGAQSNNLFLVNDETTVGGIAFKFSDTQTFGEGQLKEQIATQEPTFWDRVKRWLPLLKPDTYPFDPITLQKDVARLRLFYQRNGYLYPKIDYPASQLDTTNNKIRIIFSIDEGPPLIIQDVGFFAPDGRYFVNQFDGELREAWIRFRDRNAFRTGDRYTDFRRIEIQDQTLLWLKDRGFAFAEVSAEATVDSTYNVADIRFEIVPGPVAYVSEINILGNESVSDRVVRRELPFEEGDRFSSSDLSEGQRELFGLNLFRLALADVPEQPKDSTVAVRLRLTEAPPRNVSAQTGYGFSDGMTVQADWTHRNFFGGARQFTATALAQTGIFSSGDAENIARSYSVTVSLRQPYLFRNKLSGILSPFYLWRDDPEKQLGFQEFGLTSTLLYDLLPFRTVTFQHTYSRAFPLKNTIGGVSIDAYDRSILSLGATLGKVNNFLNPRRGVLVRPQLEEGGFLQSIGGVLPSDVYYWKGTLEAIGYVPLTRRSSLRLRMLVGRVWPYDRSDNQQDAQVEYQFDRIRYYAGGANDVRGWGLERLGPQIPTGTIRRKEGVIVVDKGTPQVDATFEPHGGLGKLAFSIEYTFPFFNLGDPWRLATFIDAGQVSGSLRRDASGRVRSQAIIENGEVVGTRILFGDEKFDFTNMRVGAGVGIRYATPVGFIRFDVAYKVNPSEQDLWSAEEAYRYADPGGILFDELGYEAQRPDPGPGTQFLRRLRLHLSIGQAF